MNRFEGKTALVTGGASGIGRAACVRLASEGAQIFAMDVNADGLNETKVEIGNDGGSIEIGVFDVTQRAQCFEAVKACADTFGQLDVLANVAGIVRFNSVVDTSEEEWNLIHAVNLNGPFFMCQAAIPHLLESKGNIVNIASNAGLMGQAFTSAYCSSKGAIIQLTRALAMEYIRTELRVNAIAPAGVVTALVKGVEFPENMDYELMKRYLGLRPMSAPEEIASAIAYIASDEARSVHGSIFSIDNGVTTG